MNDEKKELKDEELEKVAGGIAKIEYSVVQGRMTQGVTVEVGRINQFGLGFTLQEMFSEDELAENKD